MLDAGVLPLSFVTKPSVGVTTSLYFTVSTAGYFIARSRSILATPLVRSEVVVKVVSPRKRGSPSALYDCPGSQCFASPLIEMPFSAFNASAPPSAAIAALTRSPGLSWADAKWIGAVLASNAAVMPKRYFIVLFLSIVRRNQVARAISARWRRHKGRR